MIEWTIQKVNTSNFEPIIINVVINDNERTQFNDNNLNECKAQRIICTICGNMLQYIILVPCSSDSDNA